MSDNTVKESLENIYSKHIKNIEKFYKNKDKFIEIKKDYNKNNKIKISFVYIIKYLFFLINYKRLLKKYKDNYFVFYLKNTMENFNDPSLYHVPYLKYMELLKDYRFKEKFCYKYVLKHIYNNEKRVFLFDFMIFCHEKYLNYIRKSDFTDINHEINRFTTPFSILINKYVSEVYTSFNNFYSENNNKIIKLNEEIYKINDVLDELINRKEMLGENYIQDIPLNINKIVKITHDLKKLCIDLGKLYLVEYVDKFIICNSNFHDKKELNEIFDRIIKSVDRTKKDSLYSKLYNNLNELSYLTSSIDIEYDFDLVYGHEIFTNYITEEHKNEE